MKTILCRLTAVACIYFLFGIALAFAEPPSSTSLGKLASVAESVAQKLTRCPDTIDEVRQKSLIKVWQNWDKIEPLSHDARINYVKRIARNELYGLARKNRCYARHLSQLPNSGATTTSSDLERLIRLEDELELNEWLDGLDPEQRRVIELKNQGESYRSIAKEMKLANWQRARNIYDKVISSCPHCLVSGAQTLRYRVQSQAVYDVKRRTRETGNSNSRPNSRSALGPISGKDLANVSWQKGTDLGRIRMAKPGESTRPLGRMKATRRSADANCKFVSRVLKTCKAVVKFLLVLLICMGGLISMFVPSEK